ncbi:MAG: pyridoxamine 5'-phosphate oxidase family protein [Candidatus Dojkabacteria bacterium]|jgi:uncharacterized protein YhbP (UPF0306 family)|nr:pyridoxamine 5'-phosphate oxidase family protein [Candidatus Dojkabacteria bacterium]
MKVEVLRFLESNINLTLATSKGTQSWCSVVIFASDNDFTLYFTSDPTSRHVKELEKNPKVSFAINHERIEKGYIKAIQGEGVASKLSLKEIPHTSKVYLKKFPFSKSFLPGLKKILSKGFRWQFYKIIVTKIFYMNKRLYDEGKRSEYEIGC